MDKYLAKELKHTNLYVYQCGTYACESGHSYGPAVRDHFLIHYIHSGKGVFKIGRKSYHLSSGHGFLIWPGVVTYYEASLDDPWVYSWVGFHGLKAEEYLLQANLTQKTPIFSYLDDDLISRYFYIMDEAHMQKKGGSLKLLAYLYLFLYKLIERNNEDANALDIQSRKDFYINEALQYIESHYSTKMMIEDIAKYIGLNRSYLNSLFKEVVGYSLMEYLMEFRVRKACELLANPDFSIGDIARSIGYEDPMSFSKVFRKRKGEMPSRYRKQLISEPPAQSPSSGVMSTISP